MDSRNFVSSDFGLNTWWTLPWQNKNTGNQGCPGHYRCLHQPFITARYCCDKVWYVPLSLTGVRVSQGKQLPGRPHSHLLYPHCLSKTGTLTALVAGSTTGVHMCVCVCSCVCVRVCVCECACQDNIPSLAQTLTCLAGVLKDSCDLGDLSKFDMLWLEFDLSLHW